MELSAVILLTFNFLFIGATPAFFFRKDGSFNLMWFITGLPLFLWPIPLFGVYWGYLQPTLPFDNEFYSSMRTLGVLLSCCSIALISLTIGTHRIPLALWHQDNDAPRSIVTWGAYRFIRHPFYTSFIVAHTAALLIVPHWFQALLLAYQILILNGTAAREERNLSQSSFGAEYRDFITRTGRFLPKPRAAAFMEAYLTWVTQYRHLVLGLIAGFTVFFSLFLVNIGINATPYFISADHPVRVTEAEIKSIFTNTEEQAFVALVDERNGIFTQANLERVQQLTQQLERISFADESDLERLRDMAGDDTTAKEIVARVAENGLGLDDVEPLRELIAHGKATNSLTPKQLEKIEQIIIKARPVKRVRSLFTVEDIRVDGDDLEIDSLIQTIPTDSAGLQALKQHILSNPLLVGVIVSADGNATNMQVELNVHEDDAPTMQDVYAAIEKTLDATGGDAQLHFSGPPMVASQIAQVIQQDNMLFFPLVSTVICLILFISFRRVQAVVLTMTVCTLSTLWTMGFMAMFGIDVNIVTASLPVFLMTIAVADSIHYLTEYYGQLNTHGREESVKVALRHLMLPMFMTSLTDFFGFLSLSYTDLVFVREFGIFI
ncbi:MAG TPA: MMPL family transporter, partial [Dongiaceae bacterium]|nr:MMPL family transporter [Dongiaceae bacterium]